jgi:spermidine synthase
LTGDTRATDVGSLGRSLLFSSFLLTGATALVFEVVWTRLLLLSLGATAVAVGAVLGAFMGGMAVGAWLAGRRTVARVDPVLTYASLEGWAGLYGLATPMLLRLAETQPPVVQFGAAVALLMPATVGMGASLPILARALGQRSSWVAVNVGRLYAANTAGAVLGPLVAVFWLFPQIGLLRTLHVASGIDVLVCVTVIVFRRHAFPMWERPSAAPEKRETPHGDAPLLAALVVSGAVAMVYEVAWTRVLSIAFASSVYGVTIMLSAFLAGLAGGSAWASAVLRRARRPASFQTVAWLLGGTAVGAWLSLPIGHTLPRLFLALHRSAPGPETGLFATQFVVAALLMLPSALCLGAMLPVAASVPLPERREVGERISRLYTANLVGSATGAVLASAVLLGHYGVSLTVRLASAVAIATALVLVVRTGSLSMKRSAAAAAGILLVLAVAPGGKAMARGIGFYAGLTTYEALDARELRRIVDSHHLLYYRDGPTATVAVHEVGGYRVLMINGKTDASNGPGDMQTQLLLAHLPLMAHEAKRVAVVGWGSGVTAGAALTYPVEHIDAFEIEPAVVEGSAYFDDVSGEPLRDPRLQMIIGDARALLRRSPEEYDVIISEPSNPWITGIANLFTQEYFRIVASRLSPDGVVCQWFHLYGMSEESTRSLVATFGSVFPERLLFRLSSGRDVLLLGSRRPIRFPLPAMRRVFEDPERSTALGSIGLHYPFDLLVELTLDTPGCEEFSRGAPLNTDDNMRLELSAPRTLYVDRIEEIAEAFARHPVSVVDHVTGYGSAGEAALEQAASLFTAERNEAALAACEQAIALEPSFAAYKLRGQILQGLGRTDEARRAFEFALSLGGEGDEQSFVRALLRSLEKGSGRD